MISGTSKQRCEVVAAEHLTILALDLHLPTGRTTYASWFIAGSQVGEVLADINSWAAEQGFDADVAKAFIIETFMAPIDERDERLMDWTMETLLWLCCRCGSDAYNAANERMARAGGYTLGVVAEVDEELDWAVTAATSVGHPLRSCIEELQAGQKLH